MGVVGLSPVIPGLEEEDGRRGEEEDGRKGEEEKGRTGEEDGTGAEEEVVLPVLDEQTLKKGRRLHRKDEKGFAMENYDGWYAVGQARKAHTLETSSKLYLQEGTSDPIRRSARMIVSVFYDQLLVSRPFPYQHGRIWSGQNMVMERDHCIRMRGSIVLQPCGGPSWREPSNLVVRTGLTAEAASVVSSRISLCA